MPPPVTGAPTNRTLDDSRRLGDLITASLEDDKAQDILRIDLEGKSSLADEMIIASGRSSRHVSAIADHVLRKLKDEGHGRARIEGQTAGDWVLIDAGDVIVHLFRPEVRAFYDLERIWFKPPAGGGVRAPRPLPSEMWQPEAADEGVDFGAEDLGSDDDGDDMDSRRF
jgi:ribosome-associated protein